MTSKNAKKNLPQTRIPRISTRGFYDLSTGKKLKKKSYNLYPKKFFENLDRYPEFTIMIHGLRNDKAGALAKVRIAQKRLRQLGYGYPVVGFSYDSNVKNAHIISYEKRAIKIGKIIARKNANNLAKFISDCKKQSPNTRIRLMGHSLGSEVIVYALEKFKHKKNIIEAVYFFGGSIPANSIHPQKFGKVLQNTVAQKITNYYSPYDDVLKHAYENNVTEKPIGYLGKEGKTVPKYVQKQVKPKNHRFASYTAILRSFP
jgi:hypothetical protein